MSVLLGLPRCGSRRSGGTSTRSKDGVAQGGRRAGGTSTGRSRMRHCLPRFSCGDGARGQPASRRCSVVRMRAAVISAIQIQTAYRLCDYPCICLRPFVNQSLAFLCVPVSLYHFYLSATAPGRFICHTLLIEFRLTTGSTYILTLDVPKPMLAITLNL